MMKQIPKTENTLVLRTDFTDEKTWKDICQTISTAVKIDDTTEFKAYVDFVSDPAFDGLEQDEILSSLPDEQGHFIMFVVDTVAIKKPNHPLLCIDLTDGKGKNFRVVASEVQGVENNLSVGNFCFDELAELVDEDGVFQGIEI